MITFVYDESGDWEGLFKDGKLLLEGHTLSLSEVLNVLGIHYHTMFSKLEDGSSYSDFADYRDIPLV